MRLLDHIAQCTASILAREDRGDSWRLTSASDFASAIAHCPLRYVLADPLVRTCTALTYAEGDELSGCLDLSRIPAEQLWVEWNDVARRAELTDILPQCDADGGATDALRAGALISAEPGGRSGRLLTFWLANTGASPEPLLAPVETLIALDGGLTLAPPEALLEGQTVSVQAPADPPLDALLQCLGFRLEPSWLRYYREAADTSAARMQLVRQLLGVVAFDAPMLLALFLLMAMRDGLTQLPVQPARLNAKRARLGRQPLLEHIELSAPIFASTRLRVADGAGSARRGPRFHHVRGHIVRRRNTIYWRAPHWRGHMRLGTVRTRTVELRLPG